MLLPWPGFSLHTAMLQLALGALLAVAAAVDSESSGNNTALCADCRSCSDPCARDCSLPANVTCFPPAIATSRLTTTGSDVASNSSAEKPLSTTTKFSPSPFLGMIPDRRGSLVVGEVFPDSVGQRPHTGYSLPRQTASVREYTVPGEHQHFRPASHSLEIQVQGAGDYRPSSTGFGRPDLEIHPGHAATEIEILPAAGYRKPDLETEHKPLSAFASAELRPQLGDQGYGRPAASGYGRPDLVRFEGEKDKQISLHKEYGKPYDPGNALDYTGFPDIKPKQPFYEGYENMKNLLKPSKGSGPYFFEDNFPDKPIQENTGEDFHKNPFPPALPVDAGDSYKHVENRGPSKWKSLLRFLTTVLPIGLLFAALTPNVLVVSPSEEPPSTGKGGARPTAGNAMRSLEAPLGPCGLRRLCEALSESPADFQQFLLAAKQGSTVELREIIKKAEEKDCKSIGCMQVQELKPTQPTYR